METEAADDGTGGSVQLAEAARNGHGDRGPRRPTIARMEGRLRRISEHTCVGELHGYLVHVGKLRDGWFVWLMPRGEWTECVLRVDSLAAGAKLARGQTPGVGRPGERLVEDVRYEMTRHDAAVSLELLAG